MARFRQSCTIGTWFVTVALMALRVQVADSLDTTPPNVTCDDVTTLPNVPNSFFGLDEDVTYTYEDDNPNPSGVTYNVSTGLDGDLFPPGRTPVALIAVDTKNNMATCVFYVTNPLTELPVNCPNLNRTVTTDTGKPTYTYTPSFGASDVTQSIDFYRYHGNAVSVDPEITVGSGLGVGTHPETVMISDDVLNKTCMGYILVEDVERPNVTCPADIVESSTNVIQFSANVSDNVGASLTYTPEPGSRFNPGMTTVFVTARDQADLNDTCNFMVQMNLSELPVECPPDESVELDTAESTYQYPPMTESNLTLMSPTYEFYGDVTIDVLVNDTDNYTLSIGTYIITSLVDDTVLNKTCSSVLTVVVKKEFTPRPDTTPPNVTCDDVTTLLAAPNSFFGLDEGMTYTYEDENPDPSGTTYNVSTGPFGALFPPGRTPVTLIANDTLDNMATCVFYVTNPLTELPVNCPNLNRTVGTDTGQPTYTYTPSFGATDVTKNITFYRYHGNAVSVDPEITVGSGLGVGTHPETVMISDDVLNKTCMGYILVEDVERPNVTCPADIAESSTNVIQFSADVFDNVGASLTYSPEPGSRFNPGMTTVSVTARDQAGLNDTCNFMVQMNLSELPVDCPPDKSVQIDTAESTYQYPPMTESNLTLMSPTYQFYGDVTINVLVNGTDDYTLSIGTYITTSVVDDTVLNKTCSSVLNVAVKKVSPPGHEPLSTAVIVIVTCGSVLLLIIVIGCCVCYAKKRMKRRKEVVNKSEETINKKTSAV